MIYSYVEPGFAWISLGTLRSNRELKTITERRFPKSDIFYSELLLGEDRKLRYPKFLRAQIYENMVKWLRRHDKKTPIYLCMESKDIWKNIGDFSSSRAVEKYLLNL
jgi:spore photoproduct lyase